MNTTFGQWLETEENLQNWLTGSVIQYPVYHGSNQRFDRFQYKKSKRYVLFSEFDVETKGFFFTENPHDALAFGKQVATCYIHMKNPLLDPRRDKHLGTVRLDRTKEMHLLKILGPMVQRENGEPYIDVGIRRIWLRSRTYNFAHEWIYEVVSGDGIDWDCLDNPGVIQRMVQLGYDGTFVAEPESHIGRSIFIPSADQIKIDTWTSGVQDHWGNKDDYGTQKKDGYTHLYRPNNTDPKS